MNKKIDIESLARDSLNYLKLNYELPAKGFLAGGSIANLIWERVSGNKAVINDIDIFIYNGLYERKDPKSVIRWENNEKIDFLSIKNNISCHYSHSLVISPESDYYYKIEKVDNIGYLNIIEYKSSSERKDLVLDSFDLNCVKIGYSIEEDKFYWKEDFEEFLISGELKSANLLSPAHSAIRLIKKKNELNCKLSEFEFEIIKVCLSNKFYDINKLYFSEKISNLFDKYKSELGKHFRKVESEEITNLFKEKENLPDIKIFKLEPLNIKNDLNEDEYISKITLGYKIGYTKKFLFYVRNILPFEDKKLIWNKLEVFFETNNYFDCSPDIKDVELISRILKHAPLSILNLNNLRLSEQIKLINKLLNRFSNDPIIAISILEKIKIDLNKDYDDGDYLLLELSVRKEILRDDRRIKIILGDIEETDLITIFEF